MLYSLQLNCASRDHQRGPPVGVTISGPRNQFWWASDKSSHLVQPASVTAKDCNQVTTGVAVIYSQTVVLGATTSCCQDQTKGEEIPRKLKQEMITGLKPAWLTHTARKSIYIKLSVRGWNPCCSTDSLTTVLAFYNE